jgi:hypothetical protein
MSENHPRWFQLVEMYGNPMEMINLKQENTNISSSSAKVVLFSEVESSQGKSLKKKILLSMSVAQLKAMCSKLFKIEVIHQQLVYVEEGYEDEHEFDEDHS